MIFYLCGMNKNRDVLSCIHSSTVRQWTDRVMNNTEGLTWMGEGVRQHQGTWKTREEKETEQKGEH